MPASRTKKSIKNISYSILGYVATFLLQFFCRYIFLKFLSEDYLGLNGLFSNILSILALSELGIGTAMTYSLYKPIAENDREKIKSLMQLYKKWYTAIGVIILVLGALLTPFLQIFIKEMPDIKYIRIYYLLYVLNSGISYFYTYKRSLIICDQNAYLSTLTQTIASITTKTVQIIILFLTRNYMLFLISQVVITRLENVWISKIADKRYPYLLEKDIKELDKNEVSAIKDNVKAMIFHKIGFVIVTATDNLIISKLIGISTVGLYSNYTLIVDNISSLTSKAVYSVSASVGDLIATGDKKENEKKFYYILFLNFWIIAFCSICLYVLLQRFIVIWLGEKLLLSNYTVIVLVFCFYFFGMRYTVNIFKESAGILKQDKYKALIESAVNLVFSIPLTFVLGVTGVKLGTLISTLTVPFWVEGYVLFKHYFKKKCNRYLLQQLVYFICAVIAAIATSFCCSLVQIQGIGGFIVCMGMCCVIPNLLFALFFCRTEGFKFAVGIVKRIFKRGKQQRL